MIYCAVIGDIIDSKNISDRGIIQSELNVVLAKVNEKYKDHIASLFTVTLGDEFQGLLFKAAESFNITEYIQRKMHPVRLRFGIGVGEIFTGINPEISIGADGPAYYKARDMIGSMKQKQNSLLSCQPEVSFKSETCDDELINAVALLYRHLERSWTEKQRKYIDYFFEETDNQYKIAQRFNVTQPSIYKAFERAGLYKYMYALEQINVYFKKNNY